MKDFITAEGLEQLREYKYKPGKYTKIDQLLNPYWEWVVKQLPEWIAPNLITFIGWLFVIMSYLVMLRYDYTFQKDIPNWCFLFAGACIWIYSTLDAVDGKQARRTKSSSPLGQLFDHGCDSFSITFFVLALGQAAKLEGLQIFVLFVACQSAFWSSNWTQYKTGVLMTSVGQFGVTQTELISMIVHLLAGIFGQNFWQIKIGQILPWTFNLEGRQILSWTLGLKLGGFCAFYFGGLIFFSCMYVFISTILTSQDKIKPIRQCFTFYLVITLMVIWYNSELYNQFRGMILLNLGLLCSLIICKVIISSVTKMSLPYFHFETIPTIIATVLLLIFERLGDQKLAQTVFWICLGVNLITILNFLIRVVRQITSFLGIHCFSIKKIKQTKKN